MRAVRDMPTGRGKRLGREGLVAKSEPVFEESGSSALVVSTDELVVSAHGRSMCGKPAECTCALIALCVPKLQKGHFCVDVGGVSSPLFLWVEQVRTWAPVYSRILYVP